MIACANARIEFVIFSPACHYLGHPRQGEIVSRVSMRKEFATVPIDRPCYSRSMFETTTVQLAVRCMLALGAGMALERAGIAAQLQRRGGRTRKVIDTATTNDATNVSVAIGEPGATGPSVEIDS
jgi:hypothetical protein